MAVCLYVSLSVEMYVSVGLHLPSAMVSTVYMAVCFATNHAWLATLVSLIIQTEFASSSQNVTKMSILQLINEYKVVKSMLGGPGNHFEF